VEDLNETFELLRSRWPDTSAIRKHPWGDRIVEMTDPEGRRIEFWEPER
jgi:hypothetical protein